MNISICTFNIKNYIPNYKNRSKDIYNLINRFDIICLQELTPITNIALRWLMRKDYNFYGCLFGTGIFVRKKYSIIERDKIRLFDSYTDVLKNFNLYRKSTFVQIELSNKIIDVYSCHFGFVNEWIMNYRHLQSHIDTKSDIVICGDFNIIPNDERHNTLMRLVGDNGVDLNKSNIPTFKEKTIDYIITNMPHKDSQFISQKTDASDHMCVSANINL